MAAAAIAAPGWLEVNSFTSNHGDTYPAIASACSDLTGRSVFITGASKGIGRATAASFGAAGAASIAIAARSTLAEVEAEVLAAASKAGHPPPKVVCLELDVSSDAAVKAAAEAVADKFGGRLDVLINNAGYCERWVPIAESDPEDWWRSWEVNVKGPYLCTRYFLPLLLAAPAGSPKMIINVSSAGAVFFAEGASAYQSNKLALCKFTQHIDFDYAARGVVAVSINPGAVATELAINGLPKAFHSFLTDTPELAADTMVWMAAKRREWLAGRFITVTWDMEELEARKDEIVEKDLLKFRVAI